MRSKIKRINKNKDYIFIFVCSLYFLGMILGCILFFASDENSNFLIVIFKNIVLNAFNNNISLFSFFLNLVNDFLFFILIITLKYSGVLKILNSCIPLIFAIKNAAIYSAAIILDIDILNILIVYIIKDTAIAFLLIIYTANILKEIINQKNNFKADIKIFSAFCAAIFFIHIIDVSLKQLFFF